MIASRPLMALSFESELAYANYKDAYKIDYIQEEINENCTHG